LKRDNSSLIELASETANLLFRANKADLSKSAKTLLEISKKFGFDEAKKLDLIQYRKMRTDGSGDNLDTIIYKIKELSKTGKLSSEDIPGFLGYLSRELKYLESAKANTATVKHEGQKESEQRGNINRNTSNISSTGPATYNPFADLEGLKKKLKG